jgi:hypothetical protein
LDGVVAGRLVLAKHFVVLSALVLDFFGFFSVLPFGIAELRKKELVFFVLVIASEIERNGAARPLRVHEGDWPARDHRPYVTATQKKL